MSPCRFYRVERQLNTHFPREPPRVPTLPIAMLNNLGGSKVDDHRQTRWHRFANKWGSSSSIIDAVQKKQRRTPDHRRNFSCPPQSAVWHGRHGGPVDFAGLVLQCRRSVGVERSYGAALRVAKPDASTPISRTCNRLNITVVFSLLYSRRDFRFLRAPVPVAFLRRPRRWGSVLFGINQGSWGRGWRGLIVKWVFQAGHEQAHGWLLRGVKTRRRLFSLVEGGK